LGLGDSYINPSKVIQKNVTTYVSALSPSTILNVGSNNVYYLLESVEQSGSSYIVKLAVDTKGNPITFDSNDTT
jgi:hypothetical protein